MLMTIELKLVKMKTQCTTTFQSRW